MRLTWKAADRPATFPSPSLPFFRHCTLSAVRTGEDITLTINVDSITGASKGGLLPRSRPYRVSVRTTDGFVFRNASYPVVRVKETKGFGTRVTGRAWGSFNIKFQCDVCAPPPSVEVVIKVEKTGRCKTIHHWKVRSPR